MTKKLQESELIAEYKSAIKMGPVWLISHLDEIKKLAMNLLMYWLSSSEKKTKKKFQKYWINLTQAIDSLENNNSWEWNHQDYSIWMIGDQINVVESVSWEDWNYREMWGIFGDSWIINQEEQDITFSLSGNMYPQIPFGEPIKENNTEAAEFNKIDDRRLFIIIYERWYDLEKLNDAYRSNLWMDDPGKWEGSKLQQEITFLHEIDRYLDVDINFFWEQLALAIFHDKILKNPLYAKLGAQDILKLTLEISCVTLDLSHLERHIDALEKFFNPENYHDTWADIMTLELKTWQKIRLNCLFDETLHSHDKEYIARLSDYRNIIHNIWINWWIVSNLSYKFDKDFWVNL